MDAKEILKKVNLRATEGRAEVLTVLIENGDEPMSVRDIISRLIRENRAGAVATVYRALASFTKVGLLRSIPATGGALFSLTFAATNPHLVCSRCGKVEEIKDPDVIRYNSALMKDRGVQENGGSLLMYADCKRKECD